MMRMRGSRKQHLDIINSWSYVWFSVLNIVFCLWLIASNLTHHAGVVYSSPITVFSVATISISLVGLALKRCLAREHLARLLPIYVLILGLLWAVLFHLMVKHYNTPSISLSLLVVILLPATISFYISGRLLLLFCIPITLSMFLSELTTFQKFNVIQISGSIIIFAVVITARYILLEWYTRTKKSEYAKNVLIQKLTRLAHRDALTGMLNKGSILPHFTENQKLLAASNEKLFIIMMDIDFFKQYNDIYGHMAGDKCLLDAAQCISDSLRQSTDTAFRFGGEEFLVLTRCQTSGEAVAIAERIRKNIHTAKIPHKGSPISTWLTASFGVAQWQAPSTFEDLAEKADKELYKAKQAGRNRVSFSHATMVETALPST